MRKKLLCTISDDPNMFNGLRFLNHFFKNKEELQLTLLSMAEKNSTFCRLGGKKTAHNTPDKNLFAAQEEAKRLLLGNGFTQKNLHLKSSHLCRIQEIEEELSTEQYDCIVMGRRGLSRILDLTQKSLSHHFFDSRPDIPMIFCRKPDLNRKNILVGVDGSTSSLNAARFVASMLATEPEHLVTLCVIIKGSADERKLCAPLFREYEQAMKEKGLDPGRIRHMIYPSDSPAHALLDNANWGKFAVVAVGSSDPSAMKQLFYGSTTSFLFTELQGAVLWVYP